MGAQAAWLVVALVVAAPVLDAGWTALTTSCFLTEFLSGGRWRPLSAITPEPVARPLPATAGGRPVAADLYSRRAMRRPSGLVLVHGLSPPGKDEPRLRQAAALLARAGWAVAVPTVDGLTRMRLRPDDAGAVVAAVEALRDAGYAPVAILGISLGAGPGLLAAGDPLISPSVSAVLALGGYASTVELLRYTLTGAFRFEALRGHRPPDEGAIAEFARANGDLLDDPGHRLIRNRDPEALDRLVAALPLSTRSLLDDLSPAEKLERIHARLFLVHGRDDPAVPFTETLRLARAAEGLGRPARVAIVGGVGHVEPGRRGALADLWRLWITFYAFRVAATVEPR
jgi:dipeptidyl aminopeptidase/acylaminoacyl peptidase